MGLRFTLTAGTSVNDNWAFQFRLRMLVTAVATALSRGIHRNSR